MKLRNPDRRQPVAAGCSAPGRFRASGIRRTLFLAITLVAPSAADDGFRHFGDYLIRSRLKITGDRVTKVAIKPLRLSVSTDGVTVRVSTEGDDSSWSGYTIYRSDGVGRQSSPGGPLEVVPGIQATNDSGGAHRHLRLTRDTLTITVFPGISDQTIVTHATSTPAGAEAARTTAPPEP